MKRVLKNQTGQPVYAVVVSYLRALIVGGELNPGDMLPSENSLVSKFEASRETVRKGLKQLDIEGYIYSQQGKGYFVSQPKHDNFLFQFDENLENANVNFKKIQICNPDSEVKAALKLAQKKKVIEIVKTISIGAVIVAYDLKYLPYDKGQPLIEAELQYAVFPQIAAAKTAPFAFSTKMEITAESANQELATTLKCEVGTALLVVKRYLSDKDCEIIGYGKQYMLPPFKELEGYSGYLNG